MHNRYISPSSANPPGLLRKTVTLITTIALAGVALMFSAMLLVVSLAIVGFGGAYLWWKTRELRKQMTNSAPSSDSATMRSNLFAGEAFKGEVIEGEVIRIDESRAAGRH